MASRLSKPLTAESDGPFWVTTSARVLNQRQANRNKRKARHDAAEANQAEGEKLMDRKVLTATAKKVYTLDWIKRMQGVVRAFMEFTEEKLCASPNHPEHGAEYFKPHGLALNENLVWQFLGMPTPHLVRSHRCHGDPRRRLAVIGPLWRVWRQRSTLSSVLLHTTIQVFRGVSGKTRKSGSAGLCLLTWTSLDIRYQSQ